MCIRNKLIFVFLLAFLTMLSVNAESISDFSGITDMSGIYELTGNVVISEEFRPIGTESVPFTGTFDGKGYSVTGGSFSALFAYTENATVKNLNVENVTVNSDDFFGGIVGKAGGKTVIENCYFSGVLNVDSLGTYALGGGIAGIVGEKAAVKKCGADVVINVADKPYILSIGGIAGENRGTVEICYTNGSIIAVSDKYRINLGGVVGENKGTVAGCFNNASVDGSLKSEASQVFAGGIAGFNNGGRIERAANLAEVSGTGVTVYPVYLGGITGMNLNGTVSIAKNNADMLATKAFAGGIAGYSLGHKFSAKVSDMLNLGSITSHDSLVGGIIGKNVITDAENSSASVMYALNLSGIKAIGMNVAAASVLYSTGADDGFSTSITADVLKTDGIPELEKQNDVWVNNTEVTALPDLLVVYDTDKATLIASNKGDSGDIAYYLYSPTYDTFAKSFTAVYYNGTRYIGMTYTEKTPEETFARLKTSDIPEGTTRIKFIAFSETFVNGFKPAAIESVEIEYAK